MPKNKTIKINVENIPCYSSIGIHEEEKKMGQKLLIDVHVDIESVKSDQIKDTLSYVDIYKQVQEIGKLKSYSLIETLAEAILDSISSHPSVKSVKVKVKKPHIPYPEFQGDVSVEMIQSSL